MSKLIAFGGYLVAVLAVVAYLSLYHLTVIGGLMVLLVVVLGRFVLRLGKN
jgi:hypothetical protein